MATRSLFGRQDEVTEITALLQQPDCELVCLTGPSGIGKSALTMAVADAAAQPVVSVSFEHSLTDQNHGPAALISQALASGQNASLLVLDSVDELKGNFGFISDLLSTRSGLKILAASRYPLELPNEWVVKLRGLDFRTTDTEEALGLTCASQLFVRRVWTRLPGFDPLPHRRTINFICACLEGSPLGITLAADLVGYYSIPEIASRLTEELDFLSAHAASQPARHPSVRSAMDSSWHQLSPEQQDSLARLSLFSGGISQTAATKVARCTRKTLATLVECSWLRMECTRTAIRYGIHPLLRRYGLEKLAQVSIQAEPQPVDLEREHAFFFRNLLTEQADAINAVDDEAFYQIDLEYQNVRQAWLWLLAHQPAPELIQFVDTLLLYCIYRNHRQEAAQVLESALTLRNLPEAHRARWSHLLWETLGKEDRMHCAERRRVPRIGLRDTTSTNPLRLRSVAPPAANPRPRLIQL